MPFASTRQQINSGSRTGLQQRLRDACITLGSIIEILDEEVQAVSDPDVHGDDMALIERLLIAKRLIEDELPTDGKCRCCGRVRCGP